MKVNLPDLSYHNEYVQTVSFSVEHCEIPNSFYIINYSNNIIVIDNVSYSIPVGNYNVRSFIAYIMAQQKYNNELDEKAKQYIDNLKEENKELADSISEFGFVKLSDTIPEASER